VTLSQDVIYALVAVAIMLLIGFPIHEFSHAFAAFQLGDSTARWQGRLSLDPRVHFDPIGGLMLILGAVLTGGRFFLGWAKPTPVNPYNLRYGRRGEAIVAAAGPVSNLIMATAVAIPVRLIGTSPELFATVTSNPIAAFLYSVAFFFVAINVFLMVFNLLPIPPLDGWRVLLGLVDARTAYTLRSYEQYGFLILVVLLVAGGGIVGNFATPLINFLLGR
jgi:Zn-dependent protease